MIRKRCTWLAHTILHYFLLCRFPLQFFLQCILESINSRVSQDRPLLDNLGQGEHPLKVVGQCKHLPGIVGQARYTS